VANGNPCLERTVDRGRSNGLLGSHVIALGAGVRSPYHRIVLSSFFLWPLLANRRLKAQKASGVAAEDVSLLFFGHEID